MKYDGHQDEIATAFCEWPRNDRIEMRSIRRWSLSYKPLPLPLTVNMKYDGYQDEIATAFCEWPRNDRIEMREFKRGAAPLINLFPYP
jgi:hypothetical protein